MRFTLIGIPPIKTLRVIDLSFFSMINNRKAYYIIFHSIYILSILRISMSQIRQTNFLKCQFCRSRVAVLRCHDCASFNSVPFQCYKCFDQHHTQFLEKHLSEKLTLNEIKGIVQPSTPVKIMPEGKIISKIELSTKPKELANDAYVQEIESVKHEFSSDYQELRNKVVNLLTLSFIKSVIILRQS